MYSPRIYESQIPSLYHASQSLGVPMTQLVNAFVYHGLAGGYYGQDATKNLPAPNQVLPPNAYAKLPIFEATEYGPSSHMLSTPPLNNLTPYVVPQRDSSIVAEDSDAC